MRVVLASLLLAAALGPAAAQEAPVGHGRAVKAGAGLGAGAGVALGGLAGLVVHAVCEVDCGSPAGHLAGGALLGGAVGGVIGGLVGAAIPRGPGTATAIGEAGVRAGALWATSDDPALEGAGPLVEAFFGPRFGPVVVLLEGGYGRVSSGRRAWRAGGAVRGELGRGPWHPYAIVGLAGYSDRWEEPDGMGNALEGQVTWFGGSLGVGVRRGVPGSAVAVSAELRAHRRLQDVGPPQGGPATEFVALFVAGHVGW